MLFQGKAITLKLIEDGIAELVFDLQGESVNKFSVLTMDELDQALVELSKAANVGGLILTSAKPAFIVGADILEFKPLFLKGEEAIKGHLLKNNECFNRLEDFPFPTVVEINGYALGGGYEVCLACDYRVMSTQAKVGLPETKLGIMPGWGGTVRLPRIAGIDVAIDWVATGKEKSGAESLKVGLADAVVEPDMMRKATLAILAQARAGKLDYLAKRKQKTSPMTINDTESLLAFGSAEALVKAKAGRNYPAPLTALRTMQAHHKLDREAALAAETQAFAELAGGDVASSLVGIFLNDQMLVKKAKTLAKGATKPLGKAAVLGAGIMGGGIAYQSARKGTPIVMKDIVKEGLDLGIAEATKLLTKQVNRGRMKVADMASVLTRITPSLSYEGFDTVDIVVEAVVENLTVKNRVLADVEKNIASDAVLCSNTSTLSISLLAESLQRPENFCGMHFFNPVHAMPLVEVIRGAKSSDETIAATVAYALALGKKAVVVNDCPGFLVNRILFPYFAGFAMLLRDGADFQVLDKTMERWGWPMGPAYLADVVGIDTCVHCESVVANAYPDRMGKSFKTATDVMFEAERFGQKNSIGFYSYQPDKKGKPQKLPSDESYQLLKPHVSATQTFSEEEMVLRMMLPMATEMARCLEDGIVATPEEADIALIYGLGFPPFRGGVFRWMDTFGLDNIIAEAGKYASLGKLYQPTEGMLQRAKDGKKYCS
ncbi:MAG: fatty acid oxidation complex subunit alpha FadB [Cellvibrionaceae bacterium]|nr:fatty acid oxidation complex subunit alpha FadB [Cellvibrionaceae bacterium]